MQKPPSQNTKVVDRKPSGSRPRENTSGASTSHTADSGASGRPKGFYDAALFDLLDSLDEAPTGVASVPASPAKSTPQRFRGGVSADRYSRGHAETDSEAEQPRVLVRHEPKPLPAGQTRRRDLGVKDKASTSLKTERQPHKSHASSRVPRQRPDVSKPSRQPLVRETSARKVRAPAEIEDVAGLLLLIESAAL
jgi:hypothetical protein